MPKEAASSRIQPAPDSVLDELRLLEPIFHTRAFGSTLADFERRMDVSYSEVGASGRRYSRAFILETLQEHPPIDAGEAGWVCSDHGLQALGPGIYLLTYTLRQGCRITRRATVWRESAQGWQILYHQGTIVAGEDETPVGPSETPATGKLHTLKE